jgi:hypothetical protein
LPYPDTCVLFFFYWVGYLALVPENSTESDTDSRHTHPCPCNTSVYTKLLVRMSWHRYSPGHHHSILLVWRCILDFWLHLTHQSPTFVVFSCRQLKINSLLVRATMGCFSCHLVRELYSGFFVSPEELNYYFSIWLLLTWCHCIFFRSQRLLSRPQHVLLARGPQ